MKINQLSDQEVEQLASPLWEQLIAGANAQDYSLFSKNFSQGMLDAANEKEVKAQWATTPALCHLASKPTFLGCLRNEHGIRVLWKQCIKTTSEELLGHMELIIQQGKIKIDGAQIL